MIQAILLFICKLNCSCVRVCIIAMSTITHNPTYKKIMPCLRSTLSYLGLRSTRSPSHLVFLQYFLLHPLLENFFAHHWYEHIKSLQSHFRLPQSFIRMFASKRQIVILVPRGHAPFGQHQESRPLARSNDIPFSNGFENTID